MVWGCFDGNNLCPIVSIDSSVNSDKYTTLPRDHLFLYLDALANDGVTGITFQQDNARSLKCKKSKALQRQNTGL